MDDWRIGRYITTKTTFFSDTNGVGETIPGNRQRVGLLFYLDQGSTAGSARYQLLCNGVIFGCLNASTPMFYCAINTHGQLPSLPWTTLAVTSTHSGGITEFFSTGGYSSSRLQSIYEGNGIMNPIKLSPERIAGLQQVQREFNAVLTELDKGEECGVDCSEYRRIVAEESARVAKMIEHFGGGLTRS